MNTHTLYYSKNMMALKLSDDEPRQIFVRNLKGYLDTEVTKRNGTVNGHDYVDMGLPSGTLWATCNIGASTYDQRGTHFAFGETMPKIKYNEDSYKFYFKEDGRYNLKKYCSSLKFTTSYDFVDGKDKLDLADDVASLKWGSDWRLPTNEELEELIKECDWEKFNDGVIITGPNGNSIFLPAAGWRGDKLFEDLCGGNYLSNCVTKNSGVFVLDIKKGIIDDCKMFLGYSIRPVLSTKKETVSESAALKANQQKRVKNDFSDDRIFDVVEEMPMFPNGPSGLFEYLSKNTHYPIVIDENGIRGRVIVTFVVEPDGSTSDVKVIKSVDPMLDKEAVRLVESMPRWIPGKQNGNVVRVKYTLPVTFKLP